MSSVTKSVACLEPNMTEREVASLVVLSHAPLNSHVGSGHAHTLTANLTYPPRVKVPGARPQAVLSLDLYCVTGMSV